MMDGKILVPSSAVAWVHKELEYRFQQRDVSEICRMFCEWLSKNPILPTEEQAQYMYDGKNGLGHSATIQYCMTEWQRRMFLVPEPEVCPVEKALRDSGVTIRNDWLCPECEKVHEAIIP